MKTTGSMLPTPRVGRCGAERALRKNEAIRRSNPPDTAILNSRLIAAQESERRRIARELHDNVAQKLALLCMEIGSLGAHTGVFPAALTEAVARLSERARDITNDVHCLSHDLHPPKLELLGLSRAIAGLCDDVSERSRVRVEFRQGEGSPCVSPDAALCLFRITQEALQNVVRHSGARAAVVRLVQTRQNIRLDVSDSGKGFAGTSNDDAGLGLLSMRERVHAVGGRIVIRSVPGQGTCVAVTLPTAVPALFRRPMEARSSHHTWGTRDGDSVGSRQVVGIR
jgi:signal transduction histidine kinase